MVGDYTQHYELLKAYILELKSINEGTLLI